MLVFIPWPFPRWLCRGVSSYPPRQRPRFSHWEKPTRQRPAHFRGLMSNTKKPEWRREEDTGRSHQWHCFLRTMEHWASSRNTTSSPQDFSWLSRVSKIANSAPGKNWNLCTRVSCSWPYWCLGQGLSVSCGMSTSFPGLFPLDASSTCPAGTTQSVSRHCHMSLAAEVTPARPLLCAPWYLLFFKGEDSHSYANVWFPFTPFSSFRRGGHSPKLLIWQVILSTDRGWAGPGRSPGLGAVSCPLSERLPVLQLVELCPSSPAGRPGEIWWKPHCSVHEMWFTPPRYWILICYMCLFNAAFLFPFLRMKSRLFSAQSGNQSVIKFSFSFSFEAFMPLKRIYMLHILNKVWSIVLTGFKHAEVLAPFSCRAHRAPQKGEARHRWDSRLHFDWSGNLHQH